MSARLLPAVFFLAVVLAGCSPAAERPADPAAADSFAFRQTSIELPMGDFEFPDGPNVELVSADCIACHSPDMALTQPALSAEQWRAIILKMRDVYKASIEDDHIDPIIDYFMARQPDPQTAAPTDGQPSRRADS